MLNAFESNLIYEKASLDAICPGRPVSLLRIEEMLLVLGACTEYEISRSL